MTYLLLFFVALAAATIVPAQSEAFLVGLLLSGTYQTWVLLIVASLGNITGSVINWLLGRGIERFKDRKYFPVKSYQLNRASTLYKRYGRWSLLLSWVPIIGDPITVVAGVLRERFIIFLVLVTIAKTGRYIIIAIITLKLFRF